MSAQRRRLPAARQGGLLSSASSVTSGLSAAVRPWDLLLIVVAAHVLVSVGQVQLLLPFLLPLRLGLVTAVAGVVLLLMDSSQQRRLALLDDPTSRRIVTLLVWATVTIPFALYPRLAFEEVTKSFFKVIVMYFVMVGCIRGLQDLERLTFIYFAGTVAYCLYVLTSVPLAAGASGVEQVTGGYDPNDFATLAVSGAPLALFFMSRHHPIWVRAFASAGIAAIAIGVVLSGSRGGLVAFFAVALYVLFRYRAIPRRWRIGGLALVVVAVLGTASDAYWERMRTILHADQDYNVTAETGRTQVWKRGVGYMLRRPLTGVGANNFTVAEGTISPLIAEHGTQVRWTAPHNSFVQIGAELGVPGIVVFLAILHAAFGALRRGAADLAPVSSRAPPLGQALTASLIGMLVGAFFLTHGYSAMLYALIAQAVGYRKVARLASTTLASRRRS